MSCYQNNNRLDIKSLKLRERLKAAREKEEEDEKCMFIADQKKMKSEKRKSLIVWH
jgi:regulator of replication initiation timing